MMAFIALACFIMFILCLSTCVFKSIKNDEDGNSVPFPWVWFALAISCEIMSIVAVYNI